MKITLNLKSAYGRTLAYPADKAAQTFADMLKSKTLTRDNLNHIAALGFTIDANGGLDIADVQ